MVHSAVRLHFPIRFRSCCLHRPDLELSIPPLYCFELAIVNASDPRFSVHTAFRNCVRFCAVVSPRRRAEQWCHYISRWGGIYPTWQGLPSVILTLIDALTASSHGISRSLKEYVMVHAPTVRCITSRNRQRSETLLVWFPVRICEAELLSSQPRIRKRCKSARCLSQNPGNAV